MGEKPPKKGQPKLSLEMVKREFYVFTHVLVLMGGVNKVPFFEGYGYGFRCRCRDGDVPENAEGTAAPSCQDG